MAVSAVWRLGYFARTLLSRPQHTGETRCAPLL